MQTASTRQGGPIRDRLVSLFVLTIFVLWAFTACGPSGEPDPDAGDRDTGAGDTIAPTVVETTPGEGATGVARDAELVVRFSEPMAREAGLIRIMPTGASLAASQGQWDSENRTLRVRPAGLWPSGAVTVTLGEEFEDLAGNALVPFELRFETVDDIRPVVVSTSPEENATGISARLGEIVVRFSEAMRTSQGTLEALGGAATFGAPTWSADATTVTFPVSDLEYERDYEVSLRDFVDANGNALAAGEYLEDGVLDFSTGPDTDGPRVVHSLPAEGQLDVNPAATTEIVVTFDEAMDTTIAVVTLSDGTTEHTLTGTWAENGRVLRVHLNDVTLAYATSYRLDLRAMRDFAGNAIDEEAYLVDGHLDFVVGPDEFLPFVVASTPAEGATDVAYRELDTIAITFSEAMDTSVTTAVLSGGPAPVELSGTWTRPTELVLESAGRIAAGVTLTLDLTRMRDEHGNALDTTHAYLGDGRLDFTTSAPLGEGCLDALTTAQAAAVDGAYVWTIGSLQGLVRDGGTSVCDSNGASDNGTDVLIRYDKVSGAPGTGGRYLRIVLDASTGTPTGANPFDISVMTGPGCDPSATPLQCRPNAAFHHLDLDLPAGPVWIWVSRTTRSDTLVNATITVSEVDPPRIEGDSCDLPFTTSSAIYTPPSGPGEPHLFSVPANSLRSVDIGPTTASSPSVFSCGSSPHGIDGVIRFDKPDDASVLRVNAQRVGSGDSLHFEVFDACDATASTTQSFGCHTPVSTTPRELILDVPQGPLYFWFGDTSTTVSRASSAWRLNPQFEVAIEVVPDVAAGEICSRAIEAMAGVNAVTGTSDQRFHAPSCFGASSNVEWYRVRTSDEVLLLEADGSGGLALMDPSDMRELACIADSSAHSLARLFPVGTELCVGVEMGRGITQLTVSGQTYTGIGSKPPVDLGILRPFNAAGTGEEPVDTSYWMVVSDSRLFMRIVGGVMEVSRAGGERAILRDEDDGVTQWSTDGTVGPAAVVRGNALFAFNRVDEPDAVRIHRLWDGSSVFWEPVPWDTAPSYVFATVNAATAEGTSDILYVIGGFSAANFYRISSLAAGAPQHVGTNTRLSEARGIAVDGTYVYVNAAVDGVRGIYRVPVADVAAEPRLVAAMPSLPTDSEVGTAMAIDSGSTPPTLFVRNRSGEVEAIIDPGGAKPLHLGPVITRGRGGNAGAMAFDPTTRQLYLFETQTNSNGVWLRYDP